MTGQTPVAKFRAGAVATAVWENEVEVNGRTVNILKATVQRRYKDKEGNWQSSGSFSRNEIPLAVHCLQKAFEKIVETQNDASGNGNGNSNGKVEEPLLDGVI